MSCGDIRCEQLQAVGTSGAGKPPGISRQDLATVKCRQCYTMCWESSGLHDLGFRGVAGEGLAAEPLPDMLQAGGPVPLHRLVLCAGTPGVCRAGASPPPPRLAATGWFGSSACS